MPTLPSTRLQLRTDVANIADAYEAPRWDFTPGGEVDRRLAAVHMREWKRVLNANALYNCAPIAITTDPNGNIPLTSLSTGTGDAQQNLYRVLAVGFNNFYYAEKKRGEYFLIEAQQGVVYYIWYRNGAQITCPGTLSTAGTVFVNWTPTRWDQLASDSSIVGLPTDYEEIFAHEGAARLLMKGGAETQASLELKGLAEEMRQDILQDLSRIGIAPWSIEASDSHFDWAGQ